MRWNKRLKYGSLVCLSADDFRTHFIFATVLDRDQIFQGRIGLKFENPQMLSTKQEYSLVESPAFYECYKYVMMALQVRKIFFIVYQNLGDSRKWRSSILEVSCRCVE